jgi:hypothetical protein
MIQGYRVAGKGFVPPKGSRPRQPACSTEEQSKKFRLMEWGPSCIGYFAADVGYRSLTASPTIVAARQLGFQ